MTCRKTILCLANSRKYQGRCIAGKEVDGDQPGSWIRPVSNRPLEELARSERCYWLGREPRLLDLIEINLEGPSPVSKPFQSENHRIAPRSRFRKRGRRKWKHLGPFLDSPSSLWRNGSSSYYGRNDRVSVSAASALRHSLYLIQPRKLVLEVVDEGSEFNARRRRLRARFLYRSIEYRLSVTDPVTERAFRRRELGAYSVPDAYLCVSLGEPHTDGFCYKLVAGVIAMRPY